MSAKVQKTNWIRGRCITGPRNDEARDWAMESCLTELQIIGPHPSLDQSADWRMVVVCAGDGGEWSVPITREAAESLLKLESWRIPPVV